MTLINDNYAYYAGPDPKDFTVNTDDEGTYLRIPVEKFPNEEAKQQFAEQWLLTEHNLMKGSNYSSATISDQGKIIFQALNPVEYIWLGIKD